MLPYLLSVSIVLFWTVIGRALLAACSFRRGVLRGWLLAPAVGLSVQVLFVAFLNQAGLPVRAFASPLAVALLAVSGAVLWWRRPVFPGRALAPYGIIALVFLAWAGSPMFNFGFNWVSFVNDDYTNYCMAADRFRDFGFYHAPTIGDLSGLDYRQYFFFMHALALMRFGSEHAVAFFSALTRLESLRVFMPVILAMAVGQIGAATGLILHFGRWRRQAKVAAILLAASPLFIFGTLYQLISQVGGLTLMMAVLALLTAPCPGGRGRLRLLGRAVAAACVGAALALVYPEASPFAVLAYLLFVGLEWLRTRKFPGARVVMLEYTLVIWMLLLRFNLVSYLYTLAGQFVGGTGHEDLSLSLFPYFLIPSGLASLFGFQMMNQQLPEPLSSVLIFVAFVLLVAVTTYGLRQAWRLSPMAVLFVVEFGVGLRLFHAGADFGLYKLAMFIQPALFAAVAGLLCSLLRKRRPMAVAVVLFVAAGVPATWHFIWASRGAKANGMVEMQRTSDNYSRRPVPQPGARWDSGIDNVVAAKMAADFYAGTDVHFLARDFLNVITFLVDIDWPLMGGYPHPELYPLGHRLLRERKAHVFVKGSLFGSPFITQESLAPATAYLELPDELSLFNKVHPAPPSNRLFELIPTSAVRDRLIFVHSQLGNHYYLGDRRYISFFQQEEDAYRPPGSYSGIGRFFLFRVERPDGPIYLRFFATKTFMGADNKLWSGSATAMGTQVLPLRLTGSGAVNRWVGPITPVQYRGGDYVALDLGQVSKAFPIQRRGLSAWYNREVPLDYRRLVAYGRDISALSAAEFGAMVRPRKISRFPQDLMDDPSLEYSGIYEDGWISPDSDFVLHGAEAGDVVHLKGFVPAAGRLETANGRLSVSVNGDDAITVPARAGNFDWLLPIAHTGSDTRITLHFSAYMKFDEPDDRAVAARIQTIEVEREPSSIDLSAPAGARPFSEGIDVDGWAKRSCFLWCAGESRVAVEIEYPGWSGVAPTAEIDVSADSGQARTFTLKAGMNSIVLDLDGRTGAHRLAITAGQIFRIPPPDGREAAFRILSIAAVASGPKPGQ